MSSTSHDLAPHALYARSHGLPLTASTLVGTAVLAAWAAHALHAYLDPGRLVPVVALAPMLAAAAIGTGLQEHSAELNRTAVHPWWSRRLAVLLALTALAAGSLALAVPGGTQEFGAAAIVRNLLGAEGISAAATAMIGARLSWLPVIAFLSSAYLAGGSPATRAALVWNWPVQPGSHPGPWLTASLLFLGGVALYTVRGARREDAGG
ncbi:hypothetical protein OG217_25845 [Streptomyces sp. NBC_01023]|uniref:hypothetical protein n=1 Tax=Streptomyces sp. NBC_01023 TaxID=2903724 RepID=UPI00386B61B7|nr:hypothetical protein OG217_25845 [Streptomyces sp. NBC_01023]